jgi:hypothetical protein
MPTIQNEPVQDKKSVFVSSMIQLPEEVVEEADFDFGNVGVSKTLPPIRVNSSSYTREVQQQVQQLLGTDVWPIDEIQSIVKPDFTGNKDFVEYDKLICRKIVKPLGNVEALVDKQNSRPTPLLHIGPGFLKVLPGAHINSVDNEYKSLCGRHLLYNHSDKVGLWNDVIKIALPFFNKFVNNVKPYSIQQWICDQPPHKRQKYTQFRERLDGINFDEFSYHVRNFFIKDEVLVPGYGCDLRDKCPRGIQGLAKAETNLALGPFMHVVSRAIAAGFGDQLSYSSGQTPESIGQWYTQCKKGRYHFYEDDFSAFDSSQGKGAHEAEMAVYKLFGPDKAVLNALQFQAKTVGFGRYHKYKTKYTRKSGDQNTSIGNTIINMMAHIWAIHCYNLIGNNVEFKMLALGDDNLLAVKGEKPDFVKFMNDKILLLGLVPKFFMSGNSPSYCSSVFIPVANDKNDLVYVLVPEVLRRLSKIGWTVTIPSKRDTLLGRLKANELANMNTALVPVLRVFNEFYTSVLDVASSLNEYRVHAKYNGSHIICESTFNWFQNVYGVSYDEIIELEEFLKSHLQKAGGSPSLWWHPVAAKMYGYYHMSR